MNPISVKENMHILLASVEWSMKSCGLEVCIPSVLCGMKSCGLEVYTPSVLCGISMFGSVKQQKSM
jgi:hypothetical protein